MQARGSLGVDGSVSGNGELLELVELESIVSLFVGPTMASRRRAIGFVACVLILTGAGIFSVHSMQKQERLNLHRGVIRDQAMMALKEQQRREQQQENLPVQPSVQH